MFIVNHRKIFYVISAVLFFAGLFMFFSWGLKLGVDFTGGSLLEIKFDREITQDEINHRISSVDLGAIGVQKTSEGSHILRFKEVDEETHQQILADLGEGDLTVEELRFNSIGPVVGDELKQTARLAVILAIIVVLLYIGFAFRKITRPLSGWTWGLIVAATLIFNAVLVLGAFSFLGKFYGVDVGLSFIAAILAVIGYSVHDNIIIFDRIRENIIKQGVGDFPLIVGISINQSIARSVNTSVTVLLVLLAMVFLGGETIKYFVLTLALGIGIGTCASIFLSSPLLVTWAERKKRV